MRRVITLIAVASLLALLPSGPAGASDKQDFTFYGGGWGHGLGLSQWGAYGLAQEGWTGARILTHFYRGTRVTAAKQVPATLRIGLVQGRDKVRLEAANGKVELRLGSRTNGQLVGKIPIGEMWTVRAIGGGYRILDGDGKVVADHVGGPATDLFAVYQPNDARVRVPEAGHVYGRGWIEFGLYDCQGACAMRLNLVIGPEPYLYGLGEVPSSWPMEALKAQAIAARTYALRKVATSGQHRPGCDCALYASSYDQVYAGWDKEGGPDGARWVRAVDDTKGRVVTYQGEEIQAFYMSSSGGFTEDNENVWGGSPVPYLRGVCDPGDYTAANPNATWTVTLTPAQVTRRLKLGIGTVTEFRVVRRGVSGRIVQATVVGDSGSSTISGETLRSDLALADDRLWINRNLLVTGGIRGKYDQLDCGPGLPTSPQTKVAGGLRQTFEDATIYASDATGAHALDGPVLAFYGSKGGPGGKFGFPITDTRTLKNGNTRAAFEHGVVTCSSDGSCWT